MKHIPFYLLLFLTALLACGTPDPNDQTVSGPTALEDFNEFYARFHRDTAYQALHITFPLEGLPTRVDRDMIDSGNFRWQRGEWVYHQLPGDADFEREFKILGERMVIETLTHRNGDLGMERRWAKMDGEWYLIYFVDLNRLK